MNRNRTILRKWLGAVLGAVIIVAAVPATAWAQTGTNQGVRVKTATGETTTNVTSVASEDKDGTATSATPEGTNTTVSDGTIITAGNTKTVTVTTTGPRVNSATGKMQVAKVKVTKKEDFLATGITITSAEGDVTTMNGNATLQMTANFSPTYTDNKTVVWSVAPAPESSATATIDENGLLTAGTVQGDVVVTAMTQDGSNLQATKTITITTIPLTADMITVAATSYTGSARTPTVTVNDGTRDLVQGTDFTLGSWDNNVNAGTNTASVTVTGMGAYTGSIVKTFSIAKGNQSPSINDRQSTITGMSCTLSGSYNTSGPFQLQVYNNNTWNDVTTGTELYQGKFRVYNSVIVMITNNPWRLLISGNDNWNDYTSGNLR